MANYKVEEITDKNLWEKFVLSRGPKSFLQSWNWGEVNRLCGAKIIRLGFKNDGKLVGVSLLIKEDAKRGPHFVIPGGPILDWKDKKLINLFIKTIKELGKKEKVWFIRVRPELLDTEDSRILFEKLGFVSAPMHLNAENTWVLDIRGTEEQILSSMRKTTRYLVKRSQKEGLELIKSDNPDTSKLIYDLQAETAKRHGFVGFSKDLFRKEIEIFAKDKAAHVFICKKGKRSLAAAIIIFYGDTAYYHFSGSISDHLKIPFSYFLQWEVIKEAKRRGINFYNFWGVAPDNNPKHRFYGVTLFKKGFGGTQIDWLHARDLPIAPFYWLTFVFETGRRILRHL